MQSFLSLGLVAFTSILQTALADSSGSPPSPPAMNGSLTNDWLVSIGPRNSTMKGYDAAYAGVLAVIDQRDATHANYTAGEV